MNRIIIVNVMKSVISSEYRPDEISTIGLGFDSIKSSPLRSMVRFAALYVMVTGGS